MARKGSAGRTRSKFFPNGWTNQNQERDLNQAINGQSEGSNQPRSSQSPKTRESRSEPTNQNARINKSVPVTPDQTPILSPDSRPLTPDGPKNENEMLSSSLPSSFFHKSKFNSDWLANKNLFRKRNFNNAKTNDTKKCPAKTKRISFTVQEFRICHSHSGRIRTA